MKKLLVLAFLLPLFCKAQTTWQYAKSVDEMTSKATSVAFVTSPKKLDFPPPYNGGSTAKLKIQYTGNTPDVFFSIDKGQINDDIDGITVLAKFDDEKPQKYDGLFLRSGDYKILGLLPAKKFINKALTAKKLLLQITFYESGSVYIPFEIEGLDASKLK
jgi:hypothetical protein